MSRFLIPMTSGQEICESCFCLVWIHDLLLHQRFRSIVPVPTKVSARPPSQNGPFLPQMQQLHVHAQAYDTDALHRHAWTYCTSASARTRSRKYGLKNFGVLRSTFLP